jgi:hypothetical protein|tara:strand:+ start:181 stop:543 length:363 start_codon:yes stop_codon:yes gene_type:complete
MKLMKEKEQVFRVGGFWRWLFSMMTFGSSGDFTYNDEGIEYKSNLMNFGGHFKANWNEIRIITKGKFLDFIFFPRECEKIELHNGRVLKVKWQTLLSFENKSNRNNFLDYAQKKGIKIKD